MKENSIAIAYSSLAQKKEAQTLAEKLNLPLIDQVRHADLLLIISANNLALSINAKRQNPFFVNFLNPKLLYRIKNASVKKELLAKALGHHPRENPVIVDATAGFGYDSFILASLGFELIMLEQSAVVAELLNDAIKRALTSETTAAIVKKMHVINTEAVSFFKNTFQKPDIIYLDPMFPERKKSAATKKEMALLRALLGTSQNTTALIESALACAKKRVVIKRPLLLPSSVDLGDHNPSFTLSGKTCRFDVYLIGNK